MLKRLHIILLTSLFAFTLNGQDNDLKFTHLSINEGLSGRLVKSILQDREGFMWFGTKNNGLNKYDGYNFKVFKYDSTRENTISGNSILCLFQSTDGMIWIGTKNNGLNRLNPYTEKFQHYKYIPNDTSSLSNNTVTDIIEDDEGFLWVATLKGINRFNPKTNQFHHFYHNPNDSTSLPGNSVICLHKDSKGDIWIGMQNNKGLCRYDIEDKYFTKVILDKENEKANTIYSIVEDNQGDLWAGTENGAYRLNTTNNILHHYSQENKKNLRLSNNIVLSICEDNQGNVWIGTAHGLNKYIRRENRILQYYSDRGDEFSISNNGIIKLYESSNGVLWLSTYFGLDILDLSIHFKHYRQGSNSTNSIRGSVVQTIFEDHNNFLWVGTKTGGLNRINRNNRKVKHFYHNPHDKNSLSDNNVLKVKEDKQNNIWVCTQTGGLNLYNPSNNKFIHYKSNESRNSISSNFVYTIHQDQKNSNTYWIGTNEGLDRFNLRKQHFVHFSTDHNENMLGPIRFIEELDGNLWLGSSNKGLFCYNKADDSFTYFPGDGKNNKSIDEFFIKSMHIDQNQNIWAGHLMGVNCIDPVTMSVIRRNDTKKISEFTIVGILEDDNGFLWMSTNKRGLIKLDPDNFNYKIYDDKSGIQLSFFEGSCFKNDEGELFFGGTNGFNSFFPDDIKYLNHVPPIAITKFYLFNDTITPGQDSPLNKGISYTDKIILNHKQNFFSFEYALLNYKNQDKTNYAYILEGFEDAYNFVGNQRKATYTNVPPGNYLFRVIAAGDNNIWTDDGASVEIKIKPPFWQTWLFKSSVIFLLLIFAPFYYIRRMARVKKMQSQLEKVVTERTSEVMKQRDEIEIQRDKIKQQSKLLEEQNYDLTNSIEYATKIQSAILPTEELFNKYFSDSFILFLPKAILSGDFYYIEKISNPVFFENEKDNNEIILATVDCTGHGVPGALMSVIGYMVLNQAIKEQHLVHTDEILNFLDVEVKRILRRSNTGSRDGMDIALCKFDLENKTLEYSGAYNNLYIIRNNKLITYKADRFSIGTYLNNNDVFFKRNQIDIKKGDCIYIFSDGYQDQLGGISKTKKYSKKRLLHKLQEIHQLPAQEQKTILNEELSDWMLGYEQMDDILVIGVKV